MKLYDGGKAPNPRKVRVFLAEKHLTLPLVPVDLGKLEHKSADITGKNPKQRMPVLELDDGTIITESTAICRYIEALHPQPNLFGTDALDIGLIDMWVRRIEFDLYGALQAVFRHGHPAMATMENQVSEWAAANRPVAMAELAFFNAHMRGRDFVICDRYSFADICLTVMLDFLRWARVELNDDMTELKRYQQSMAARPSYAA